MGKRVNYIVSGGAFPSGEIPPWWRGRPLNMVRIKTILLNLRRPTP